MPGGGLPPFLVPPTILQESRISSGSIFGGQTRAQYRVIVVGIYARRKLNGDPDVITTDNEETLNMIAEQGERVEAKLKTRGDPVSLHLIEKAHREAV